MRRPSNIMLAVVLACGALSLRAGAEEKVTEEPALSFNTESNKIYIACRTAELGTYDELGGRIEYLLTGPGGKAYESLFSCDVKASDFLDALKKIKLQPGSPAREETAATMIGYRYPRGDQITITAEWTADGKKHSVQVDDLILDTTTGKSPEEVPWTFTGSRRGKDPDTGGPVLLGDVNGNLIALHHRDSSVLIQNARPTARDFRRWKPNGKMLPKADSAVTLVFEPAKVSRKSWLVSGTLQNLGYRSFVQQHASLLGIAGWVRNRDDGKVEIVAQGRAKSLASFEETIRHGPRGVVVESIVDGDRNMGKLLGGFLIRDTVNKKQEK